MAEGEVDAGGGDFFGFGELVLPVGLGGAGHQEEAAVLKVDRDFFAVGFVAEVEAAFGSEAEGGNGGGGAELFFVILMPAHPLFAFLIEIGEAGVKVCFCECLDLFFDGVEFSGPREGLVGLA